MKKLLFSLLAAAAASIPASAMALRTQVPYSAFFPNRPVDLPAGTVYFDLDADIPGHQCRYYLEWDSTPYLPISADGFVDEAKAHGAASCFQNAYLPIHSIVTLDPHYPMTGFTGFQQLHPVFYLVLGEDGELGSLNGLIGLGAGTSPTAMFNPFELVPVP